jgi:hypothetical protein
LPRLNQILKMVSFCMHSWHFHKRLTHNMLKVFLWK